MPSLKNIDQQLLESQSIELVTESLGQVAAIRFKDSKDQIQHNSLFFTEVSKVYRAVQGAAAKHRPDGDIKDQKNGRTVNVLLTSNAHFNGGLDRAVAITYLNQSSQDQDRIVIGTSGINYLTERGIKDFQKVRLAKDLPNLEEIKGLINAIKGYSRILVYYSRFVTVLDTRPDVVDLTEPDLKTQDHAPALEYILEPELKEMINFFEGQILAALLNSIFLETNLARTAARMVSMDQAQQNAKKEIEKEKKLKLKMEKFIKNLSALENYVSDITMKV